MRKAGKRTGHEDALKAVYWTKKKKKRKMQRLRRCAYYVRVSCAA